MKKTIYKDEFIDIIISRDDMKMMKQLAENLNIFKIVFKITCNRL